MKYPGGTLLEKPTLPELRQSPTRAKSSRNGQRWHLVWLHRWGGGTIDGVISEFKNPANEASSHIVYASEVGRDAGRCVQMVRLADKAWTEAAFNSGGVSIESADAIWLGHDPHGFSRLARMVAWLLHHQGLPAMWVHGEPLLHGAPGFTRHADGGSAGGGHTACPTTDIELWSQFAWLVRRELQRASFRHEWAL